MRVNDCMVSPISNLCGNLSLHSVLWLVSKLAFSGLRVHQHLCHFFKLQLVYRRIVAARYDPSALVVELWPVGQRDLEQKSFYCFSTNEPTDFVCDVQSSQGRSSGDSKK